MIGTFFFCLTAVWGATTERPLKDASFIPQWKPQAQFAGYYVAFEKGFYRREGINLSILVGDPRRPPAELLQRGEVDFATMWLSSGIERRSKDIRVVNLAQIVQRSSLMLVAKKTSGIARPSDMNGKKVGVWKGDFQIQPEAFFRKYGLNVRTVAQGYSVNLFLRDGIDVASAMWYNEYHTLFSAGLNPEELNTFYFSDHGLNFPEDGIYMMEGNYQQNQVLAQGFVRASIDGWLYAFEHPEEALQIVIKYMVAANVPANTAHQRWMLSRMKDIILPKGGLRQSIGILDRADFLSVAEEMKAQKLIPKAPRFEEFGLNCVAHAEK